MVDWYQQLCKKPRSLDRLFPSDWPAPILPSPPPPSNDVPRASKQWGDGPVTRQPRVGKSLLEIYGFFTVDPALKLIKYDPNMLINDQLKAALEGECGASLLKLARGWSLSDAELGDGENGWEMKVEELAALTTLIACATGRTGHPPKVDFSS